MTPSAHPPYDSRPVELELRMATASAGRRRRRPLETAAVFVVQLVLPLAQRRPPPVVRCNRRRSSAWHPIVWRCRSDVHRSRLKCAMLCAGRFGSLPTKSGVRYRCERLLPSARGHCRPRPASWNSVCPHAFVCLPSAVRTVSQRAVVGPGVARVTGKGTRCFKACAFHSHDRSRLAAHSL